MCYLHNVLYFFSYFFNLDAFIHNFCLIVSLESDYLSDFIFSLTITTAGIMACPFMLSKDNIELQFATNHLDSLRLLFFDYILLSDAVIHH